MKKIILVASTSLLLLSSFTHAGLYRWVDDKGEVHFSDKVPVAATRKAVSKMNKNGIVQKTVDPEAEALAKLEFEANASKRAELEALKKIELEKTAEIQKRDEYLLSTYENKEEITKSYLSKVKLIKGNEAILDAQTQVLKKRLSSFEKQHSASKEGAGKDALQHKIININETISQYKKALTQNEEERLSLGKIYKVDLARYIKISQ